MSSIQYQNLPSSPGVYFFRDRQDKLLYIGKAINLKRRVTSYFRKNHFDPRIEELVGNIAKINYQKTDSAIEALILEANLIRRHQPFYNIKSKDDKSFVNIAISREDFPQVFVIRPNVKRLYKNIKIKKLFGPYPSAKTARTALKILRRIFPFRGLEKTIQAERFYKEILEIPGSKEKYRESIKNLILFFEGKKKRIIGDMEHQMRLVSKKREYEEAAGLRDKIFALRHIQDVALIKDADWVREPEVSAIPNRIEAYDISNIFGRFAAGSMVVFTNGKIDTDQYRRFKIKYVSGISDTAMLSEVLRRRFNHWEWKFPDLIVIDGGLGQLNAVKKVLTEKKIDIPLVSIAKGPTRRGEKLFMTKNAPYPDKKIILAVRDEAHRFAISYHRKLKRAGVWF